MPNVKADIL